MKRFSSSTVLSVVCLLSVGVAFGQGFPTYPVEPGQIVTLESGTYNRSFWIYSPEVAATQRKTPLVFGFHGFGGWEAQFAYQAQLVAAADEYGFIVVSGLGVSHVTPLGVLPTWNAGGCCFGILPGTVLPPDFVVPDDIQYVRDVLSYLEDSDEYRLGLKFATGMSNGAQIAHRLACEASDLFHGFAPHSHYPMFGREFTECVPETPRFVLDVHGTADATVAFEESALFIGFENTLEFWLERNQCNRNVSELTIDNADTTCTRYTDCAEPVEFCRVEGLTHTWSRPGDPMILLDFTSPVQPDTYVDFTNHAFTNFREIVDANKRHGWGHGGGGGRGRGRGNRGGRGRGRGGSRRGHGGN